MPRPLVLLLSLLPSLFLAAAPFPVPVSLERPVSQPVAGIAAGMQMGPFVASNGQIALAAWSDTRTGVSKVYATRIDGEGHALDPQGIDVGLPVVEGVVWNGTHFLVLGYTNTTKRMVMISPEGRIEGGRTLGIGPQFFFAAAIHGSGARLLYLRRPGPVAAIVDGEGEIIAGNVDLPLPASGYIDVGHAAGTRGAEFIVVRQIWNTTERRALSTRLGADGSVLSTADAQLPVSMSDNAAVMGGPDGYLLVTQDWLEPVVVVYRLDANGVYAGSSDTLLPLDPRDRKNYGVYYPRIVRERGRFVVSWHTSHNDGHSYVYAAEVPDGGSGGPARQLWDWVGITYGVAFTSVNEHRVVVESAWRLGSSTSVDVYAQRLGASLDAAPPSPLSYTAGVQTSVVTAAGANGYLVAYRENSLDGFMRLFVRRVSPAGEAQDAQPLEVMRSATANFSDALALTSNGEVYVVAWWQQGIRARRLSARTGEWLDMEPFHLGFDPAVGLASNGTDAMAVTWSPASARARRIALSGAPLIDPPVDLRADFVAEPALASNGTDYLVAWSEGGPLCIVLCPTPLSAIVAMRIRADGTKLDAAPLVLEAKEEQRYGHAPAVAWNGGRYLVAWTSLDTIRAAAVSAEGAIGERVTLRDAEGPWTGDDLRSKLVAHGEQFVLLTRRVTTSLDAQRVLTWDAVAFHRDADLATVAATPRAVLLRMEHDAYGTLDAASSGTALLVAYDRLGAAEDGGVPRAFVRLFGNATPRRRAVR